MKWAMTPGERRLYRIGTSVIVAVLAASAAAAVRWLR